MPLEIFNFIEDLVPTNPLGTDPKSQGDDHIRGLKETLVNQFTGLGSEAVTVSAGELNGFVGMVAAFAAAPGLPAGWLLCDGQEIVRLDQANLFAFIGTTYGVGDGSLTFNLPDYRGSFLRGQDLGAAVDPDAANRTDRGDGTTGDAIGTKQTAEFESHGHDINTHTGGGGSTRAITDNASALTTSNFVNAAKVKGGPETRPVNVGVQYFIHI